MSDVRTRTRVSAAVDRDGDASFCRTWVIQNIGSREVVLNRGYYVAWFTNPNVTIDRLQDGSGLQLPWRISARESRHTEVECFFNVVIPPRQRFVLHLEGKLPAHLVRLQDGRGWAGTEYFEHQSIDIPEIAVEDSQEIEYVIQVEDPRRRLPFFHNPFQEWQLASSEHCAVVRAREFRTFTYSFRLPSGGRSEDLTVVSTIGSRAFWAGMLTGGFWTVLGAIIGLMLQR